jgi:hypothetical protein
MCNPQRNGDDATAQCRSRNCRQQNRDVATVMREKVSGECDKKFHLESIEWSLRSGSHAANGQIATAPSGSRRCGGTQLHKRTTSMA